MVTKEIATGSQPAKGGAPVVSQSATNDELAKKFATVLGGLLGGANIQALIGGNELPAVQAAAPLAEKEKEPEPEPVEKVDDAVSKDEVTAGADKDDEKKQVAKDEQQPATEEVAQVSATVVQAEKPKAEEVERTIAVEASDVTQEAPAEAQQVAAPVQELQTQNAELAAQHTEQVVQTPAAQVTEAAAPVVKAEKPVAPADAAQPVEQQVKPQDAAVTAAPVEKAVSVKQTERKPDESYYAIQRALESNTDEQQAAPVVALAESQDAKTPVNAPKAGGQEAAAAQAMQGMMMREAAEAETKSVGALARNIGANHAGEIGGVGGQAVGGEKLVTGKLKPGLLSAEINQQRIIDQVKDLLKKAAATREGNTLMVRLNPPELGELTVKVTQRDHQVYARIIPESKEVEAMLRERAGDVQQVLIHAGLRPDQVHVAIGTERSDSEMFGFNQFLNGGQSGTRKDGDSNKEGGNGTGAGAESADWKGIRYAAEDGNLESGWVA